MDWCDEGIILHARPIGESGFIVSILTQLHGRHAGVVRISKKNRTLFQIGAKVKAHWKARLESHLGFWTLETLSSPFAFLMDKPKELDALVSVCSLCQLSLPERHKYEVLYQELNHFFLKLLEKKWIKAYINFEMCLLNELGYGLDLSRCIVTGVTENLVAVSPRTGKAVSSEAAAPYKERLLKLPSFILDQKFAPTSTEEIIDALVLTGHFLERYVFAANSQRLPLVRQRLLASMRKNCVLESV